MSPSGKKPSDPDLEFGFTDEEEAPTGKYTPVDASHPKKPRAGVSERETLPAPTAGAKGSAPKRKDSPSARAAAMPYRRTVSKPRMPNEKRTTAPAPALPVTRAPAAARPSQIALDAFDRALADSDEELDFDRAFAPSNRPYPPQDQIAPRPPRMPEIAPSSHAALDLEELPKPPLSAPPEPTAPPASSRKATTPARRAARPNDDDLAWEPKGRPAPVSPDVTMRMAAVPLTLDDRPADAHALADRASRAPLPPDPHLEMNERFALGDFSGALVIAEGFLAEGRRDHDIDRVVEECRAKLSQMYIGRLGDLRRIPVMAVPRTELKWLSLDHRAGFVLSLVDGASSLEEIIDVAGMSGLEVLRTLFDLVNQKVIELRMPGRR